VVRKDSGISSLKDLNGKKLAFPAPNAMAASLLIRFALDQNNIQITPEYVKTHGNVYRSVALGDYIAGGGVNNTFKRESPVLQNELRVLFETPKIMPHPVAVHPRVPVQIRQAVARTFVELGKDSNIAKKLDQIQIPKPIEVSYERDYQNLEKLGLEKFLEKPSD
jgi:phosphonate transport system substrate-binding protein